MKVEQFPYLSAEAMELRRRDGVPPWGVHVCEVDSLATNGTRTDDGTAFHAAWLEAKHLRDEIERTGSRRARR